MVENKQVRFALVPDFSTIGQRLGAEAPGRPIADWVRANGTLVDSALWRSSVPEAGAVAPNQAFLPRDPNAPRRAFGRGFGGRMNNSQLYDLRPEAGVVPVPSG
jgi:hypothetical protein